MPTPKGEFCDVRVEHMLTLLGGRTYIVRCDHKPYAVVSTFFDDGVVYVTLTMDDQDVELRFSATGRGELIAQGPAGSAGTGYMGAPRHEG